MKITSITISKPGQNHEAAVTVLEEGKVMEANCYGSTPEEAVAYALSAIAGKRASELTSMVHIQQIATWKA
jgi:hypothetical protein